MSAYQDPALYWLRQAKKRAAAEAFASLTERAVRVLRRAEAQGRTPFYWEDGKRCTGLTHHERREFFDLLERQHHLAGPLRD